MRTDDRNRDDAPRAGQEAPADQQPPADRDPATDAVGVQERADVEPGAARDAGRPGTGTRFVFIDTETTGLDFRRHELTEVAWIVRFEDGRELERQFFPEHTTDGADDSALELTRYHEQIAPRERTPASVWLTTFLEDARGAVLVGAVPDFDARHLDMAAFKLGLQPTWDHHLLDVETLALPLIAPGAEAPRSLAKTCAALGLAHDKDRAHGALYDARQAMRVFDAVWALLDRLRRDGAPLPPPVPRIVPAEDETADDHAGDEPGESPARQAGGTDETATQAPSSGTEASAT